MTPEPTTVDVNADLGEGCPHDAALLALVTSASVSCGAHAGDPDAIRATLTEARARGVAVGAHPGYADREGFGRRNQKLPAEAVRNLVVGQVEWLAREAKACGVRLRFVKPHGALYNQAQREPNAAFGVVGAMQALGLPLLGQPETLLERMARGAGIRYLAEGFPDRRYDADGRLEPRTSTAALIHDPAEFEDNALRLVALRCATLCVHGDDTQAVANAARLVATLRRVGLTPRFWGDPD